MLDTLREVETPEGVALHLRCAGVAPRSLAWLVDFLIRFAILAGLGTVLGLLGGAGAGAMLVAMFLVFWGYPIVFEVWRDGQTPGKRAFGLKVVCDNGTPVTWLPSVVRNLLRTVDMLPLMYSFGVASCLVIGPRAASATSSPARWWSMPSARRCVRRRRSRRRNVRRSHCSWTNRRALIAYAERAPQTTPERQAELADLLSPLTGRRGAAAWRRCWAWPTTCWGGDEAGRLRRPLRTGMARAGKLDAGRAAGRAHARAGRRTLRPSTTWSSPAATAACASTWRWRSDAATARACSSGWRRWRSRATTCSTGRRRRAGSGCSSSSRSTTRAWCARTRATCGCRRPCCSCPFAAMLVLVQFHPELVHSVFDTAQIRSFERMYDPASPNHHLGRESGTNLQMFGYYILNNISIGFRTFASGLLLGVAPSWCWSATAWSSAPSPGT
jgi:uncharacterized RDD family membrane protein YckC